MGLRENISPPPRFGTTCAVRRLAASHPDIHAELLELLDDPTLMAGQIADALDRSGHPISAQVVRNHRNGVCRGCR